MSSAVCSSNARTAKRILLLTVYFSNTEELQSLLFKKKKKTSVPHHMDMYNHRSPTAQLVWLTSNRTVDVQRKKVGRFASYEP